MSRVEKLKSKQMQMVQKEEAKWGKREWVLKGERKVCK